MIHCDTSFLIRAAVPGTPQAAMLREWVVARRPLRVSTVAWAEFLCGPLEPGQLDSYAALLGEPLPLTAASASLAAEAYNVNGRRRGSFVDCLVAAVALGDDAELATVNPKDFVRLRAMGLRVVTA
jgi:predicted nucleic acid-binding protein